MENEAFKSEKKLSEVVNSGVPLDMSDGIVSHSRQDQFKEQTVENGSNTDSTVVPIISDTSSENLEDYEKEFVKNLRKNVMLKVVQLWSWLWQT